MRSISEFMEELNKRKLGAPFFFVMFSVAIYVGFKANIVLALGTSLLITAPYTVYTIFTWSDKP